MQPRVWCTHVECERLHCLLANYKPHPAAWVDLQPHPQRVSAAESSSTSTKLVKADEGDRHGGIEEYSEVFSD